MIYTFIHASILGFLCLCILKLSIKGTLVGLGIQGRTVFYWKYLVLNLHKFYIIIDCVGFIDTILVIYFVYDLALFSLLPGLLINKIILLSHFPFINLLNNHLLFYTI